MNYLALAVVILGLITAIGYINEKTLKLTYEIALMLFSCIAGVVLLIVTSVVQNKVAQEILMEVQVFNLERFLMEGVLCFMLFAGACHMKFKYFKKQARAIGVLSIGATLMGAVIYGLVFYGIARLINLPFTLPICLMFGSIVAPTDPIAATSILKKFGLPKRTGFLIEAESLLNDGVGVALFICFSGMVRAEGGGDGFLLIMCREMFGAVAIGVGISALCFLIFKKTKDEKRRIFASLLAVSLSYVICQNLECSGAIASVVCGVMFASLRAKEEEKGMEWDLKEYDYFWDILDVLLNSALYVMLGLTFIRIHQMPHMIIISLIAIACNFAGRIGSLYVSSYIMGPIPDNYSRKSFIKLFTWGGLRGGLCVALAMSAQSMLTDEVYYYVLGGTYAIVFFTTVIQGMTMRKVCAKELP